MCRNILLLYNIENVSVDDLLVYIKRRFRIYVIYFVLVALTLALAPDYHTTFVVFSVITLVLYAISMIALFQLSKNPTSSNALHPLLSAIAVLCFNIFDLVYTMVETPTNYYALISILSIALQLSTLFILHKLRELLIARELGKEEDGNNLEQPIENDSTHDSEQKNMRNGSAHGSQNGSVYSSHSKGSTAPDIENPVYSNSKGY